MDLAQTLIRMVARAFYDSKHVMVIDALMVHSALPNEDLALLLGMQQKDLRKLCGKLKEDRLLAVHSQQETREGQLRPINKDYYYINFHATIDAIKYRIFHLTEKVKDLYKPSQEKKDYFCPRCKSQWTQLEVLDNISMLGEFLCHRCGGVLERDDISAADMAGHERQSKLMAQLQPILTRMQQIDSQTIPENDFATALSLAIPIKRDESINPLRKTEAVDPIRGPPIAVKGLAQATLGPLEVSLTTGAERAAAERAEAQRKADVAKQNALPVWHTASTVTGEATIVGNREKERLSERNSVNLGPLKNEDEDKKGTDVLSDELAGYYAQMAEEREKQAREEREADASSEEDDEDEFEDVGIGLTSGVNTPSSSMSGAVNNSKALSTNGTSGRPKQESESGSSAAGTTSSTPTASGVVLEELDGDAPAKRRKLEPQSSEVKSKAEEGASGLESRLPGLEKAEFGDKEDSDEDDVEFEDV